MRLPSRTNDPGKENLPGNGSSAIRINNPLQPKRKNIVRVSPSNTFAGESIVENSTSPQAKKFLSSAHLTLEPKAHKLIKDRAARKVRQSAMNPEIVEGFQGRRQNFTDVREFLSAPDDGEVAMVTFVRKVSLNSFDIKGKTEVDDCKLSNMSHKFQHEVEKTFFDDRDDFQLVKRSVNDNNFFRQTCEIDLKDCSIDCFSVINESYTSKIEEQFTEHAVNEEFTLHESILSNHVKYSTQISSEMLEMGGSSCHVVDIVTNMSNSPSRTLESSHMLSDKCISLMRQSQGSCESADIAKLKPVLNRINKFLSFEDSVDRMDAGDCSYMSSGCELFNLNEEEEMSFRSGETPSRNFSHSSSFRSSETPKTSIRDRLAALQDSSEQNWRKRLTPRNDVITASSPCLASPSSPSSVRKKPITVSMSSDVTNKIMTSSFTEGNLSAGTQRMSQQQQSASSECVVKRVKNLSESPSIAGRLSQLMDSQAKWVERSEAPAKDAHNFTVAGKMRRLGVEGESPLMKTKKASIRPMTMIEVRPSSPDLTDEKTKDPNEPKVVKIPKMDADSFFEQSFKSFKRIGDSEKVKEEVYSGELTDLLIDPDNILPFVRKIRPPRNNRGSANPLKTRSLIIDVSDQYLEVRTGVAELEKKRVEKERIVGQVPLAQEALAGLASRENFSRVSLRKSGSFRGIGDLHEPFKSLMLLQVKGRRVCQTRLVEPQVTSFNSGDCFLLVTPEVVHLWMGRFSNVIERAKAQDLANQIVEKHDMGVKGSCQMLTFDEEKISGSRSVSKLWGALGLTAEELESCSVKEPGPSDEDELFEAGMISTNRVYRLDDENRLQFVPEYSGVTLQCSILKPSECLVFDFGGEMYTWSGKNVTSTRRKKAVSLALDIWNEGFDYSEALINPIHPLAVDKERKASKRPDWCLFGKVSQNLETLLFKEKFIDWPDAGRMIKVKGQSMEVNDAKLDSTLELTPCSVEPMLVERKEKSSLMLEGYHIGRGQKWEEVLDGIKWEQEMSTSELDVWHVSESNHSKLSTSSFGQFHSGDTYVIRWKYNINQITRNLKGEISKRDVNTGRNRCAYFFWQGSHSSINEKGASALMTIELNQDQGVHVRLVQGKEPSCFVGLFTCRPMFVYLGKRLNISKSSPKSDVRFSKFELSPSSPSSSFSSSSSSMSSSPTTSSSLTSSRDRCKRLFVLRNELPEDSYFLEVVCNSSSLRSRTSFLLVDVSDDGGSEAQLVVWHGCKAPKYIRERICQLTSILIEDSPPSELGLKMKPNKFLEMDEGKEPACFHEWFGGNVQRESYFSLIGDAQPANHTPRLFHFSWTSGVFEAEEVQNPASNDVDVPSPFPFLQSDLYSPSQPALFLLDNHHEVFLWQGWWPSSSDECSNLHTGSASSKFMMTKRCAMQTATNYCRAKNPSSPPHCYLVHAGCEPPQFTCIFPTWSVDEGALSYAKENNLKPLEPVSDVLQKLNRSTYTWSELQEKPLPDGVDPLKLESYLDDEEFQTVMGMHRNEFTELPQWKQTNLKRKSGLF